ncbi:M20/M25/M40 family metallo-hydrolase [Bailinhaonella thermotolerans]|uniref:M20/M25/M40 family metallo-hydrolase n=2 Tax=Bailinhaonella thermotolerans TaxID=1070861 RepID=A0A3A4B3W8_9ACTN|nr:M20/M25/M40 family metallo-hydrolase [Bailinhaonella thermotolerans]
MLREIDARRVEKSIRTLVGFGTRNTLSSQDDPRRGIGAARDWIRREFESHAAASGGRMKVELQGYVQQPGPEHPRIPRPVQITNVVATLTGTQPASSGRVYVVSGHYDSMCTSPTNDTCDAPGADDDASGVAAVLEMARVMAKRAFDATIVFMAVAGEEQGLYGSTHFAEQARQRGVNIAGMITNDIVGSSTAQDGTRDPRTVRLFAEGVPTDETPEEANVRRSVGGENDSESRQLARHIKESAERAVPGMTVRIVYRRDRYLRGGDHIPFLQRGYPAVRFTEPHEDYRHQHQDVRVEDGVRYGDLPEFVDFAYTARVAQVNAAALATLARAPAVPRDARILTRRLTNDTELTWAPNPEPDLAGYEIVWRDTTEPYWTHVIPVGDVTSYTVRGMSKDNFFFGVRAVDREGHRGPVAFPLPQR